MDTKIKYFIWRGRAYNKFYVIQNFDLNAGFSAIVLYALNGIRRAEELEAIPVINLNKSNIPDFYDKEFGEDIWDYFFEPVSEYKFQKIQNLLSNNELRQDQVIWQTSSEAQFLHHHDKKRLATFWAYDTPSDKVKWLVEKRKKGKEYLASFLKVNRSIQDLVNAYVDQNFRNAFVIGVHFRGTDFAYATPIDIQRYLNAIDAILNNHQIKSNQKIFIATDQAQILELFIEKYKNKVLYTNAIRSSNHLAPFRLQGYSGFEKGRDVLRDILILSKCDHIIKGPSAVGELSVWFSRHSSLTDFATESIFFTVPYSRLQSAYVRLNLGRKNRLTRLLLKLHSKISRSVQNTKAGHELFKRFKIAQQILRH